MNRLIERPLYTMEVARHHFTVPDGSTFLYSKSAEEDRALPSPSWFNAVDPGAVYRVPLSVDSSEDMSFHFTSGERRVVSLYDVEEVRVVLEALEQPVYLDITGLSHRAWAPLIRATQGSAVDLRVIYLEPMEYLRQTLQDAQRIFDLSEKFEGLRPLPGFARLADEEDEVGLFVPMIGFEGSRLEYLLSQTQANLSNTYPVVGVPGFRPDYAFYALQGNRLSLERDFLHSRIQFAKANCPFDAFHLLREIQDWYSGSFMRVAPIGTKPHALAAVMYSLFNPEKVEIVYDNPVRARNRTEGQSRVLVYGVSAFMRGSQFSAGPTA